MRDGEPRTMTMDTRAALDAAIDSFRDQAIEHGDYDGGTREELHSAITAHVAAEVARLDAEWRAHDLERDAEVARAQAEVRRLRAGLAECHEFGAVGAHVVWPTPAPAPGLDLEAAEKRAAGFRGTFRVMAYDSGDELLEYIDADANHDDLDTDDVLTVAQFACDEHVQRAIVDTLNAAPALIAEVRAVRAQVCRIVSGQDIESDHMCQYHDADIAALAEVARINARLAEAKRIGRDLAAMCAAHKDTAGMLAALEAL